MTLTKWRCVGGMLFVALVFLVCTSDVKSTVVGNSKNKNGSDGTTVKRFTGILSGPGNAGDSPFPKATYIDFVCDPRNINWKIQVVPNGKNRTKVMGHPRVCDHIEVVMYYYNPKLDGYDGTAISIRKID